MNHNPEQFSDSDPDPKDDTVQDENLDDNAGIEPFGGEAMTEVSRDDESHSVTEPSCMPHQQNDDTLFFDIPGSTIFENPLDL